MDGRHLLAGKIMIFAWIPYRNFTLTSRMYDIEVTGYDNRTNKLHLFDVETVDESIVEDGISFDKTDIRKNLTLFLYPDDSDRAGQILRIYQRVFSRSTTRPDSYHQSGYQKLHLPTCPTMRSSRSTTPIPPWSFPS